MGIHSRSRTHGPSGGQRDLSLASKGMENFAAVLREMQIIIVLLLASYFALETKGHERLALVSSMVAVASALLAR